ncbi:MAG: cryptochrome/photolyase family protein [Halorhodospira halophila]|uniref:cryptochrome/photolyase family protein n=1 Tax=Halorhodospira halophila TaxID=1053 RepID=UPI0026EE5FAA|nr:cryptochrome/photolyase family protein [Halorhodospira halophila]MCC3752001.1 cryptochrome/photolyase family protein [Halorhodospira halophila]
MPSPPSQPIWLLRLGDQLDPQAPELTTADPSRTAVWMAEARGEAEHVPSHRARIALFISAMRHLRDTLRDRGWTVQYWTLDDPDARAELADRLEADLRAGQPDELRVSQPGDHRVLTAVQRACEQTGVRCTVEDDPHFIDSVSDFQAWARGRKSLRLEHYYRALRKRTGILMTDGEPAGGQWNFDADNREAFGRHGPGPVPAPAAFPPDPTTRTVLTTVEQHFPDHPGALEAFDWPVTPHDAEQALDDFIEHRLPRFGRYQDAMWLGQPHLFHSRIAAALNLKLLDPRTVIARAEAAWQDGHAPLASVEGFIRQILGWREYVRGIYHARMPAYAEQNALAAHAELPGFYWSGETRMVCLKETVTQTLTYGYAHHIQRLMVTGLYALLLGVRPQAVHEWYLSVYVDAVEWVELPNTLGMSQFADGGLLASKPYAATGQYIARMSNYCAHCPYNPKVRTGDDACPFTTLYWDFLLRNETRLRPIPRMKMQLRNLERLQEEERTAIRMAAERLGASRGEGILR